MNNSAFVDAFTDILVKQKAIHQEEAPAIKKAFYKRSEDAFVDFLINEGLVSRTHLLNALSTYYQVPAFDVVGYFFDHMLLHKFGKGFLLRNNIVPLHVEEMTLVLVAGDPSNEELLPLLGEYVSYDIQFMVGLPQDIDDAIKEFYDRSPTEVPEDEDLHEEHHQTDEAHGIMEEDVDDTDLEED